MKITGNMGVEGGEGGSDGRYGNCSRMLLQVIVTS